MYYVYILQSQKDKRLYIESTNNLKRRFAEHQTGKVSSTKHRRPLILLAYESYRHEQEATHREKYLKSSDGHKGLYKRLYISLNK